MKYSTKVSDAVHILCFIYLNPDMILTSDRIAQSVKTNSSYVRQLMSTLRQAGLLRSVTGHPRPELAKAPEEITLLHVYRAVEGHKPLLHLDTHTNPDCGVGVHVQNALQDYFDRVQEKAEGEMAAITLQDILNRYQEKLEQAQHPLPPEEAKGV